MSSKVTLTGHFTLLDGTPAVGTVLIRPSRSPILDLDGKTVISGPQRFQLDAEGRFSLDLPPTDDPALGEPFTYHVMVSMHHAHWQVIGLTLPADMASVDVLDPPAGVVREYPTRAEWDALTGAAVSEMESALAGAESARDVSVDARDTTVVARDETLTARDETLTARDTAVGATEETLTARDATFTARDVAVVARDETLTARTETITAAGEAESARDMAVGAASDAEAARDVAVGAAGEAEEARLSAWEAVDTPGRQGPPGEVTTDALTTALAATTDAVRADLDALEIGGRNYLLNSAQSGIAVLSNDPSNFPLQQGADEIGRWITGTEVSTGAFRINTYTDPPFEGGRGTVFSEAFYPVPEVYTQSAEVMSEVAMSVRIGIAGAYTLIQPNEWTKISHTSPDASRLGGLDAPVSPDVPVGTKLYTRNWRLERGAEATIAGKVTGPGMTLRYDTTVGTRVFLDHPGGSTMLYGDTGWRDMAGYLPPGITGTFLARRTLHATDVKISVTLTADSPLIGSRKAPLTNLILGLPNRMFPYDSGHIAPLIMREGSVGAPTGTVAVGFQSRTESRLRVTSSSGGTWEAGDNIRISGTIPNDQPWPDAQHGTPA